jgi:SAM-dependent methyltransferase
VSADQGAVLEQDLYGTFVEWYPLLDPREDHREECRAYRELILGVLPDARTLLELGAGAGNNASYLKAHFACTLSDLSAGMLGLSRHANPTCEHVQGDMRTQRLGRTFDVVLVHDAICHMSTLTDLRAALATVFAHTRPGGVALVVPDCVTESFREWTDDHHAEHGDRALQYVVRAWDPDPADESTLTDYAFLLRNADGVAALHVRHCEGLFSIATWMRALLAAGFRCEAVDRELPEEERGGPYFHQMFLCRRPD